MSSPKPFLLFRLPLVTLRKVIKQLDLFETVDLYFACRKADFLKRLVRKPSDLFICFGRIQHAYLEVQFGGGTTFQGVRMEEPASSNYNLKKRIKKRLKKESTCKLEYRERCEKNDNKMIMYWSNKWKGAIEWMEMLLELYQHPDMVVQFYTVAHLPRFMWEWLEKNQRTRRIIRIQFAQTWNREASYFFNRIDPRDDVYLYDNFKVTSGCPFDMTLTACHFIGFSTPWIKMDNIFNMNCKVIVVFDLLFIDSDLTSFVRHWLNGGNPKLQGFFVQDNKNDFSEDPVKILDGLDCKYEVFSDPKKYEVRFRLYESFEELTVEKGVIVHRSDGATLTIKRKDEHEYWFLVSGSKDQELPFSERECVRIL